MLGELKQEDLERFELRLLTDPAFVEEFDIIVNEITDQYIGNELNPNERERVEQHFLRTDERRKKAAFALALIEHAAVTRGTERVAQPDSDPAPKKTTFLDRLLSFWQSQSLAYRFATIFITTLIFAGIIFLIRPGGPNSQNLALVELAISNATRSEGAESKRVKLTPGIDALKISLQLPAELPPAKRFRVEMIDENGVKRNVGVSEQDARTVTTLVPASDVRPGRYELQLFAIGPDGSEQRVRGGYLLRVD